MNNDVLFHPHVSWVLIFQHIVDDGNDFFKRDMNECLYSNTERKFSRLGYVSQNLNKFKNEAHKYEFLLEYPDINRSNHWMQAVFPTNAQGGTDIGYEEIRCDMKGHSWGGLSLSSTNTFIDGSPGNNNSWHYPICQFLNYTPDLYCMPNPLDGEPDVTTDEKYSCVKYVRLWIKINNKFFIVTKITNIYSLRTLQLFCLISIYK